VENRLKTLVSLFLILSILLSTSVIHSTEQNATATLTTNTESIVTQTASASTPCLTPTSADTSSAQIQPTTVNRTISGHVVSPISKKKAHVRGQMPSNFKMQMELVFALRNADNFYACLASINDPGSQNYRQYLNLTTLQPYLPTPGDKSSIISHLTHRGFTVTDGGSPLVLRISANVRTVEATFGVNVNQYSVGNFSFYGVDTDPSLPQNLASMVDGITGLTNYTAIAPVESPCSGPYCPQGIQVGYSLTSLYSSGDNGGGQKVAIVDVPGDPNIQTAINTFDSQYGLPSTTLDILYPDGAPSSYDPAWASETAMDVEAVHSVAPGAGIVLLYDTSDLINAVDYVATNHLATIVTNSWGYVCGSGYPCGDAELPSSTVSSVDSRLALDAAQGLTILFASGDEGATPDGTNLGTEFPASDPNVLAVGATDLRLSGCSATTCSGYGSESGATISGGGYSGYFAEPNWQTSNIGVRSGRAVPDVSMVGGVDPVGGVGFWVYSTASNKCSPDDTNYGAGWFGCAGTSLSTPLWAGFLALASQVRGGSFGNIDPLLYQIANSASYSSDFHDITSGSNGYAAGKGWDPVTGWGSPVANSLATALAQKQQSILQVTTDKTTYTQGGTIHYTGSGFTALGSIQACLSTDNDGSLLCVGPEPNADQYGNVAGTMVVGTNIPAGPQKFYVEDVPTGRFSSRVQLTILTLSAITFYTNPSTFAAASPGSITACGTTFMNGQSPASCGTSFSATANLPSPSTGWQFSNWVWTGGISCASSSANPTSCTNSGVGSLQAVFLAQITFNTNPAPVGAISWDSCSNPGYTNGLTMLSNNFGPNSICYVPSGYTFSSWTCSGGLTCSGTNDPTVATFNGPGAVTLNLKSGLLSNPASTMLTASVTPSNPTHGSSFTVSGTLTANGGGVSGETIVLVFGWNTNTVTVTTQSGGSYTYTTTAPASTGSYNIEVFFVGDYSSNPQYLPSKATATISVT